MWPSGGKRSTTKCGPVGSHPGDASRAGLDEDRRLGVAEHESVSMHWIVKTGGNATMSAGMPQYYVRNLNCAWPIDRYRRNLVTNSSL